MKRKTLAALMVGVALAATGCAQESATKTTEAATEKATEEETTEAATTEEATEEETTEAATTEEATEEETTEAATTEEATEEETTEAATTEEATEEETTEAATTEEATEEETTEAATTEEATEEETTEAATTEEATEEETTEAATTEEATEEETTEAATTEEATEEETTEAATTEEATEEETTEAAMTEEATEEETTEAATTEEATEEETTEAESESETEVQFEYQDLPEYTAADYVTLGEYKGITVEQEPIEVSEEQIQAVIDTETVETLTEGTVEEGDTVNIDYEGTIDGETFDEGSAEGALLEIGSGTLIDGFESGLVGVAAGEEVDLNLTFPETYHSEDLAGKDVVFHVKVNSIQRVPELTDEVAAEVSDGMTAEEYRAKVREELAESAAEEQKAQSQSELLTKIFDDAIVDGYPVEVLDYMMERQVAGAEQQVQAYGMTLEEYLEAVGMTEDDFMAQSEEVCRQTLTQWMIVQAIAEEEDLMATDEEYEEELKTAAEQTGMEEAEIVEAYGENNIRTSVTQGKVLEFLMENANFVEKTEETETETETETAKETETEDAKEAETTEEAAEETAEETDAEETETETEMESETAGETETTEAE